MSKTLEATKAGERTQVAFDSICEELKKHALNQVTQLHERIYLLGLIQRHQDYVNNE